MGTTRTRMWITEGNRVHAHHAADFGARDVAAHRDRQWLIARLCGLMEDALQLAGPNVHPPRYAVAAGMITSAQGVHEVPHVKSPTGADDLAAGMCALKLTLREEITLLLVPGVQTVGRQAAVEDISTGDLMRGEETLCIGLLQSGAWLCSMPLLNLGSHWKWIWGDCDGRIAGSRTTMTGEMIHAVQSSTLLAASVHQERPDAFDVEWVQRGVNTARAEGLGRALFCVRLLDHQGQGTPEKRLSYLYGAFLAQEIQFAKQLCRDTGDRVLISGSSALASLWRDCLLSESICAEVIDDGARDAAYLKGLQILAAKSGLLV